MELDEVENHIKAKIVERPEDFEYNGITFMKKGWYDIINPPDPVILLLVPGITQGALSRDPRGMVNA